MPKDHPRIRELILRDGMRPYLQNGVWDGFTVEDDGSGRLREWFRRQGIVLPPDRPCRTVLTGSLEKQMRRMAAEGIWGPVTLVKRKTSPRQRY